MDIVGSLSGAAAALSGSESDEPIGKDTPIGGGVGGGDLGGGLETPVKSTENQALKLDDGVSLSFAAKRMLTNKPKTVDLSGGVSADLDLLGLPEQSGNFSDGELTENEDDGDGNGKGVSNGDDLIDEHGQEYVKAGSSLIGQAKKRLSAFASKAYLPGLGSSDNLIETEMVLTHVGSHTENDDMDENDDSNNAGDLKEDRDGAADFMEKKMDEEDGDGDGDDDEENSENESDSGIVIRDSTLGNIGTPKATSGVNNEQPNELKKEESKDEISDNSTVSTLPLSGGLSTSTAGASESSPFAGMGSLFGGPPKKKSPYEGVIEKADGTYVKTVWLVEFSDAVTALCTFITGPQISVKITDPRNEMRFVDWFKKYQLRLFIENTENKTGALGVQGGLLSMIDDYQKGKREKIKKKQAKKDEKARKKAEKRERKRSRADSVEMAIASDPIFDNNGSSNKLAVTSKSPSPASEMTHSDSTGDQGGSVQNSSINQSSSSPREMAFREP